MGAAVDRLPITKIESGRIVNISPDEVPNEAELARLQQVLDVLAYSEGNDAEFELDGVVIPGRVPRPQYQ